MLSIRSLCHIHLEMLDRKLDIKASGVPDRYSLKLWRLNVVMLSVDLGKEFGRVTHCSRCALLPYKHSVLLLLFTFFCKCESL